jgi:hypothetical protein
MYKTNNSDLLSPAWAMWRLLTLKREMVYCLLQKGGQTDARVLYEMPQKEGNKESEGSHHEKQEACDTRCMSGMRDKDIQDWKGIKI